MVVSAHRRFRYRGGTHLGIGRARRSAVCRRRIVGGARPVSARALLFLLPHHKAMMPSRMRHTPYAGGYQGPGFTTTVESRCAAAKKWM
jgi:hypothetical protein